MTKCKLHGNKMGLNQKPGRDYTEPAVLIFCILLQYYLFSRKFISQEAIMSGDTQIFWSVEYLLFYSLKVFNEFPWWDPTTLNGWPAHYFSLSSFNNLYPFQLMSLIGFKLLSLVKGIDINSWLIFQKTIYYFTLNLLGVYFIAREIITSRLARFFVLITFTLCAIQFHGIRDSYMFAAMPAALFFLFAFIRYSRRQDPRNLILLTFFTAVFLSSLCYAVALASFYWISLFIFFSLLFQPSLISSSLALVRRIAQTWQGRILITAGIVVIASALVAALTPVIMDGGNLLRVSGAHPIRYDVVTDWPAPSFGGSDSYHIWNNLVSWMPFPDVHNSRLKFDPWNAGLDHRYIGLATLPLILIALVCRLSDKLVASFFLTIFICSFVLIYTYRNLAFQGLMEQFTFFQNVRTMPGLLPRDGPSLFMIFLAGIGLDVLLNRSGQSSLVNTALRRILFSGLAGILVISILCLLLLYLPQFQDIRHSLGHIGVYVGLYALICVLLLVTNKEFGKRILGTVLLVLVLADLTLSSSSYWNRRIVWNPRGAVPQHVMPTPKVIGPITDESQNWAGTYRGGIHNVYIPPFYGKREWLVFALDPRLSPMLENWNSSTRKMTAYPYFQFYTGGTYIPFKQIKEIDKVSALVVNSGELIEQGDRAIVSINGQEYPIQPGLGGFVEHVNNSDSQVQFTGWAIDEGARQPARSVAIFVGSRLWARATPSNARIDIAGMDKGYLASGFDILTNTAGLIVPRKDRVGVRAFAIMADHTARELRYSEGYPFSTTGGLVTSNREQPAAGPVYLHDEMLTRNGPKEPKKIEAPWEVKDFTLNRVKVKVTMPQDGLMMFLDNYHPYWRARLDGKEISIYRANFTFKLVQVPAGVHEIEWVFDPYPVKWGWLLFYSAFAIFIFLAWRFRKIFWSKSTSHAGDLRGGAVNGLA